MSSSFGSNTMSSKNSSAASIQPFITLISVVVLSKYILPAFSKYSNITTTRTCSCTCTCRNKCNDCKSSSRFCPYCCKKQYCKNDIHSSNHNHDDTTIEENDHDDVNHQHHFKPSTETTTATKSSDYSHDIQSDIDCNHNNEHHLMYWMRRIHRRLSYGSLNDMEMLDHSDDTTQQLQSLDENRNHHQQQQQQQQNQQERQNDSQSSSYPLIFEGDNYNACHSSSNRYELHHHFDASSHYSNHDHDLLGLSSPLMLDCNSITNHKDIYATTTLPPPIENPCDCHHSITAATNNNEHNTTTSKLSCSQHFQRENSSQIQQTTTSTTTTTTIESFSNLQEMMNHTSSTSSSSTLVQHTNEQHQTLLGNARMSYNSLIMPQKLIMVRHGQSEGNVNHSLFETKADSSMRLTKLGWDQAKMAGIALRDSIISSSSSSSSPPSSSSLTNETTTTSTNTTTKIPNNTTNTTTKKVSIHFIVSPYVRTMETFHGIASAWCDPNQPQFTNIMDKQTRLKQWYQTLRSMGITFHEDPRIREQDFGNYQNATLISQAKKDRYHFGLFYYRFMNGESGSDVYDRVSTFLDSLWRSFDLNRAQNYILVTHGVAIRVFLARYFRYSIDQFHMMENPKNCEMIILGHDGNGKLQLDGRCELDLVEDVTESENKSDNELMSTTITTNEPRVLKQIVKGYRFFNKLRIVRKEYMRSRKIRMSYEEYDDDDHE